MPFPRVYSRSGNPNTVSYDWTDINDGTGIVTFYGSTDQSSNAILTRGQPYSNLIQSEQAFTTTSTWEKLLDMDYDTTINKTTLLNGTAYVNVPIAGAGAAGTINVQAWIYLRQVRNGVETDIASASSSIVFKTAPSTMTMTAFSVPLTVYNKNDTLRLTVQLWGYKSAGAGTGYMAHDPKNRASGVGFGASDPTILSAGLPISLQL